LNFRSKKKESSIAIPHTAVKVSDGKLSIYKSYLRDSIKISKDKCLSNIEINHTCRLKNDNGKWFLYIPIKVKLKETSPEKSSCALDPGTRKFQTIYSEEVVMKISIKKENLKKLQKKLDFLQSLRGRKQISKSHYHSKNLKIQDKVRNLVDDLHYQTISYLTSTFKNIFIPKFESQELIRINKFKKFRRDLLSLRHYTFRERLIANSKLKNNCKVHVCTEEYTTQTCGRCGVINLIGSSEVYNCKNCELVIDRDVNGARNILIKNIKEISLN
jgi:putative transposase